MQLGCAFAQFRSPEIPRILKAAGISLGVHRYRARQLRSGDRAGHLPRIVADRLLSHGSSGQICSITWSPALSTGALKASCSRAWNRPRCWKRPSAGSSSRPIGVRGFGLTAMAVNYEQASLPQIAEHINEICWSLLQIETQ